MVAHSHDVLDVSNYLIEDDLLILTGTPEHNGGYSVRVFVRVR